MTTHQLQPASRFFTRTLVYAFMALLCSSTAIGQTQDNTPQRGFHPAGSYALTDLEEYNTTSGNLMFHIPMAKLPSGRGGNPGPGIGLIYNSKIYDAKTQYKQNQAGALTALSLLTSSDEGGWRYGFEYELQLEHRRDQYYSSTDAPQCPATEAIKVHKLKMSFPDGGVREFLPLDYAGSADGFFAIRPDGWVQTCTPPSYSNWTYGPITYYSTDGTYLRLVVEHDDESGAWYNNPWTLYFPDGRRVSAGQGKDGSQFMYDRNNNNYTGIDRITDYNGTGHPATIIFDDVSRYLIIEYDAASSRDYVVQQGFNGEEFQWTVNWVYTNVVKHYFQDEAQTSEFYADLNIAFLVVSGITLPTQAGPMAYTFGYNGSPTYTYPNTTYGYGELSSITLPEGTLPQGAQATYQYYWMAMSLSVRAIY